MFYISRLTKQFHTYNGYETPLPFMLLQFQKERKKAPSTPAFPQRDPTDRMFMMLWVHGLACRSLYTGNRPVHTTMSTWNMSEAVFAFHRGLCSWVPFCDLAYTLEGWSAKMISWVRSLWKIRKHLKGHVWLLVALKHRMKNLILGSDSHIQTPALPLM